MDGLGLKIERITRGLTQWDLAKKAGVHPARISEMETGKVDVAEAVVKALGPGPIATLRATSMEGGD